MNNGTSDMARYIWEVPDMHLGKDTVYPWLEGFKQLLPKVKTTGSGQDEGVGQCGTRILPQLHKNYN